MASLFVEALRSYMRQRKFIVHDFVVMPNHVHVLLTVPVEMNLESAVQLIKGGFSYRAKKELGYCGDVWQRGFSDVYVPNTEDFRGHQI
jgi:putative transposase